jgi:CrcB protein
MWKSIVAISVGGSLGCLLRWFLGMTLSSYHPQIPPGTLTSNLIAGYVIGVAVAVFASFSGLSPEWRSFVVTRICGGLSTVSSELVTHLEEGRPLWACGAAGVHLIGSVVATFAGIGTVSLVRSYNTRQRLRSRYGRLILAIVCA